MNLNRIVMMVGLVCAVCLPASAQWQWTDQEGRKVFSDRPPPADIPDKNVLKRPALRGQTSDAASAAGAAPQGGAGSPRISGIDKELMEKKKQAADAQAAQRKADEEKMARTRADNCARAKLAKAGFDSGRPISRTNEKGERELLDEAARADEVRRIQSIIDADCL